MTLSHWLAEAETRLAVAGVDTPRLDAQMLAAHILLVDRSWVLGHPEAEIDSFAAEALLQRRAAREPLAYILGWREFYGRRFTVRRGVLIPRQETETLVEVALEVLPQPGKPPLSVLDLGTGSGCIAITLKLERPDLDVTATDISPTALEVALANAEALGADISFFQADTFEGLPTRAYDFIATNPPYIADGENLMCEVANHEPSNALYAGPTGLEFYQRLAHEAANHLTPEGWLLVEVGHTQARAVRDALTNAGWSTCRVWQDLSGVERVVGASRC